VIGSLYKAGQGESLIGSLYVLHPGHLHASSYVWFTVMIALTCMMHDGMQNDSLSQAGGKGTLIFFVWFIKISIINTYSLIFIFFGYKNGIGKPIRMIHFLNKIGI
jgi:hypothetical protein